MSNHKQTLFAADARTKLQLFLQRDPTGKKLVGEKRRFAWADGVIAISGEEGVALAQARYGVNVEADDLVSAFYSVNNRHGTRHERLERQPDRPVTRSTAHKYRFPNSCAEAHLWTTLFGIYSRTLGIGQSPRTLHLPPASLDLWVFRVDDHGRLREDSPCGNCCKWVRKEFRTLNGRP